MTDQAQMNAWYERYEEERRRRAELQPDVTAHNKQAVLSALKAAGIIRVEVHFDGYGDSGQIDSIDVVEPKLLTLDGPQGEVEIRQVAHDGSGIASAKFGLPEAIERLCYDLLEAHHPGWENNEGAFGDFVFDTDADQISYTHNTRIEHIDTDEHQI